MLVEIKVPSVGESVTEAILVQWFKKDGDMVKKGEPLFLIETDKVTLEVESEVNGVLKIAVAEEETVAIGAVIGTIDTEAASDKAATPEDLPATAETASAKPEKASLPEPTPASSLTTVPSHDAAADIVVGVQVVDKIDHKGLVESREDELTVFRRQGLQQWSRQKLKESLLEKKRQNPSDNDRHDADDKPIAQFFEMFKEGHLVRRLYSLPHPFLNPC